VRPASGQETHQLEEGGARRQDIGVGLPLTVAVKRAANRSNQGGRHRRAGEIRHEEQVEMRQMIGQVLASLTRCRQAAVGRRRQAGQFGQRRGRRHADCATEQMPQMRGTITSASSGAARSASPRNRDTAAN
jgi:hypothetical protein